MATPTPVFPGAVATDSQLKVAANQIQTTLKVAAGASDTVLFVNSVTGIPSNCLVSIDQEIIAIASVTGGGNPQLVVATNGRGADGTAAASHSAGATCSMLIDAWHHNQVRLEIEAIETALGPNPTQMVNVGKYNWPCQTPAQSLAAGSVATISLSPFPAGITSLSVNAASVYITDSTSGNEAVQITGVNPGVSISIAAPVHSHTSGQWSICPASGGAQECAIAMMATGGSCYIPSSSPITVHAAIVVPGSNSASFASDSMYFNSVLRASDYPSGDLFYAPGASGGSQAGHLQFHNICIQNGPGTSSTGVAIHVVWGTLSADHLFCWSGVFMALGNTAGIQVSDFGYYTNAPTLALPHAIWLNGCADSRFTNGRIEGQFLGAGIEITGADSLDFDTVTVNGMQTLVLIDPPTGQPMTNIRFHGMEFDAGASNTVCTNGFKVVPLAGVSIGSISLKACDFLGYSVAAEAYAINLGSGSSGHIGDFKIVGCHIFSWNVGIGIGALGGSGAAQSLLIESSTIKGHLTDGIQTTSCPGLIIKGCQIIGNSHYGINILSGAVMTGLVITGNAFTLYGFSNTSGPINIAGALSQTTGAVNNVISNNAGIDDVVPAIASAATLTMPINPMFTITGTTGIVAASMTALPVGANGTLRTTTGAITFTAGSGIGNTLTTVQNVPVVWTWDGVSLWLK